MKRYVCTVATGLLLALTGTGTATAGILPLPGGQSGSQVTSFGDQSVGEQRNDADVTQAQGNGNLNVSPAIGIFGDAETTNAQGNGNTANATVDQSNSADQSQTSTQEQSLDQSGGSCCGGQSQTGEQTVYGGDQSVDKQKNDADVAQYQGNGNVNVSPAIALFGDAESTNYQGNGNTANATVTQSNEANQSQSAMQKQYADQSGGSCCGGQSQTGEQRTDFGDQYVGEQKNEADVTQKQGNGNVNVSPTIAIFGDAKTTNAQGNGNTANATVDQSNSADQSQSSYQKQSLDQSGGSCCGGQSQTGEQKTDFGDQYVGEQKNEADVDQWQGNGNLNVSPAIGILGNGETTNKQGNGNTANATVTQSNSATQSQAATQKQFLEQDGGCCKPEYGSHKKEYGTKDGRVCCDGSSQTGEQKTDFGDQYVGEQKNEADVTQKQGNWNGSFAPAIGLGGKKGDSCYSKCERSAHPVGDGARTTNYQGNWNEANANVGQSNSADQSQSTYQRQSLAEWCKGLIHR
jgi:hypothetical protein